MAAILATLLSLRGRNREPVSKDSRCPSIAVGYREAGKFGTADPQLFLSTFFGEGWMKPRVDLDGNFVVADKLVGEIGMLVLRCDVWLGSFRMLQMLCISVQVVRVGAWRGSLRRKP